MVWDGGVETLLLLDRGCLGVSGPGGPSSQLCQDWSNCLQDQGGELRAGGPPSTLEGFKAEVTFQTSL